MRIYTNRGGKYTIFYYFFQIFSLSGVKVVKVVKGVKGLKKVTTVLRRCRNTVVTFFKCIGLFLRIRIIGVHQSKVIVYPIATVKDFATDFTILTGRLVFRSHEMCIRDSPKAVEGLEFFLKPDFSKITPSVIINALGQAFFSLSLGMGILITYSSYFPKDTKLTRTAVTVSLLDLLVAVMMGFIIFPAVESFGLASHKLEGATLVFVTRCV